jgi:hypothetical protein
LWCDLQFRNPIHPTEELILNYLCYLKNIKKSYSVICTHKSVIVETLKLVSPLLDLSTVTINRFMKGLYNTIPPKPRYSATWDVSKVLNLISTWMPLKQLSLKKLTYKLTVLIALSTAARVQTLQALCADRCVFGANGVSCNCGDKLKTSKPGNDHILVLSCFEESNLCPVRTLKSYLSRTKKLRKSRQLFVSFVNFKAVSTSTIARWLKDVLMLAGIDTNTYKAHSYRGASVSAAYMKGCRVSDILKMADWSSVKNFKKFYLRNIEHDDNSNSVSFTKTVLSSN